MAMAQQNETAKKGDIRLYMVSCLLFVCIISGGVFLGMYISLPESESESWYPVAGMVLVGIPWIFWFITLIYTWLKRVVGYGSAAGGAKNSQQHQTTPAPNVARTASGATSATSASADSPRGGGGGGSGGGGGAGHVRFGAATVISEEDDDNSGGGQGNDRRRSREGDDDSGTRVSSNNGDGSSLGSHESEMPLAFSMS